MSHAIRLRFGEFELDLRTEELFHNGLPVKLARQPFRVLSALARRPGEIVGRDGLRTILWSEPAIDSLAEAIERKSAWVPMLDVDPRFETLRETSGYARLLEAAGFR